MVFDDAFRKKKPSLRHAERVFRVDWSRSDLVIAYPTRFRPVIGLIDLEIGEE